MSSLDEKDLIYDWNLHGQPQPSILPVEFDDETLRDGLQSPSVTHPPIDRKIEILHWMEKIGVDGADIGFPAANPRQFQDTLALAQEIARSRLSLVPNCAGRTTMADLEPIVEISQCSGLKIEVATFIGSSPIRQFAEGWDLDYLLVQTEKAVLFCVEHGLPVMFVTEDSIRSQPHVLEKLYTLAIECGARRICLCDTVGHATPQGTKALVRFAREIVARTGEEVKIDWHGHRDRGLSVLNSISAAVAGVDRLHATALGIGERSGNTPMELLLINMKLMGYIDKDLHHLKSYCNAVSESFHVEIAPRSPVVGCNAFRTATGVHAAAILKAGRKGQAWLADRVYSGVPASDFGFQQRIEVGPMSGESNIICWLERRGLNLERRLIERILKCAKEANRILTDEELFSLLLQRY